jgi:hypothetical protein
MAMRTRLTWTILGASAFALAACGGTVTSGTSTSSNAGGGGTGGTTGTTGTTSTASTTTTTTTTSTTVPPPPTKVDKVDLLLGIDNSRSMADKQQVLALALDDLVHALTNPPCVDGAGAPVASQPAAGTDACPSGSQRLYQPISDIHIGIVSTSIGGHGADTCPAQDTFGCQSGGVVNTSNDDKGHLLSRVDPCGAAQVPTYLSQGFLAWDPQHKDVPPGESDASALEGAAKQLVLGAGQVGCGYESQLESWYRFLVDPTPYQSIAVDASGRATPSGTDNALLAQRKAFLRPDSLLAIVMLSDENDCSTKEYGQFYLANQAKDPSNPSKDFRMPRPRAVCATNPNDPCCVNCAQATPAGCPADPTCTGAPLTAAEDDLSLRCWDQKRRFGIDFLYPIDRYITGLTQPSVPDRQGNIVPNPIFSNLDPAAHPGAAVRDASMVVLTGIVGVPWQDLARDPHDLTKGLKSAGEMAQASAGHSGWDYVIGDPASWVPPLDPHMIESNAPRTGVDPITSTALAPTTAAAGTDPINGHEYTPGTQNGVQVLPNDLEYACIFPLAQARDCTLGGACDCTDPKNDNPLCEPDPNHGGTRTLQVRAKAYPGVRQLSLLKALGTQGVAASICPAQQADATRADYAYRPAVSALVARLQQNLPTP